MTRRRKQEPRMKLGDRRRSDALTDAFVRKCCNTRLNEGHLEGCVRPISRCANKVGHSTRDRAQRFIRELEPALGRMTPYRCEGCGAWHIGHPKTTAEGL
jgi:hypothetical protein